MTASATKSKRSSRQRTVFSKRVELRMTQGQFDTVSETAQRLSDVTGKDYTVSDVIRRLVEDGGKALMAHMADADRQPVDPRDMQVVHGLIDGIQDVRTGVRRIGNNVNQMARRANTDGQLPEDLAEVKQQLAALDARCVQLAALIAGVTDEA